ncbi:MAG: DNA replication/repair protein RecF [Deltaproteobacteria bacterium]|nr:DNA replication/repair protein RecF [Deltaproteobacteria bacterium]
MNRVQLDELQIFNLRNISRAQLEFSNKFNVISGKNGMGKTNLIEAVYMLGALRSFRTSVRKELISYNEKTAKITGIFGDVNYGLKSEIIINPDERKLKIDGKDITQAASHFQKFPMVLFHPGVMELVQGGPEARRRFIDRAMFQADTFYPSIFRTYKKVILNRNSMLKKYKIERKDLIPFDHQLAETGSLIVKRRREFIESMRPFFKESVYDISMGQDADIEYNPKIEGDKEDYIKILDEKFSLDKERKYTTAGPHSDDILFTLDKKPAKKYASQGQQRTVVLAAKIAETKALTISTKKIPLLLFDDVSSELDKDRNRDLFKFLKSMGGQVFITTTHPDYIDIQEHRKDFEMHEGKISLL